MSANILPGALPTRIKVAHGAGAVALGIKEAGLTTFFMIYYNQVLGFDPRIVSLILIGAMLVDAMVDPLIGRLSDATRTRIGRRLPGSMAPPCRWRSHGRYCGCRPTSRPIRRWVSRSM